MKSEIKKALLYELNALVGVIEKGDKYSALADKLSNLLVGKWNEQQKEALRNAVRKLAGGKGKVTNEELREIIDGLQEKLGAKLKDVFGKPVKEAILETYTKAHEDVTEKIGIKTEFNAADKEAIRWLYSKDFNQFWIGEEYNKKLSETIGDAVSGIIRDGLSRSDAVKLLKKKLGKEFEKNNHYWNIFANHAVTRAREFSHLSGYEKGGVEYVKISAVIDRRTSAICRELDGRVIEVKRLINQKNKLLKAKSAEEIKEIAPWYDDKTTGKKVAKVPTGKLPKDIGMPPYHAGCRTTTVVAYDYEVDTDISNENNYDVLVKKVETKLNNYGQLKPKEVSKLIEVAKNTNWGNVKIKETGLINSFHHFKKHGSEKYINAKSMKEYNSKLKGIIEDPNRDIYLGSHNVHGPQILCYKDNSLVVVSLRKMMLITFQTLKGERLKGYLKKYTKTIKLNSKGISKWINSNL